MCVYLYAIICNYNLFKHAEFYCLMLVLHVPLSRGLSPWLCLSDIQQYLGPAVECWGNIQLFSQSGTQLVFLFWVYTGRLID